MAKFPKTVLVTEESEDGSPYHVVQGSKPSDIGTDVHDGEEVAVYQLVEVRRFKKTLELEPMNGRHKPKNGRRKKA